MFNELPINCHALQGVGLNNFQMALAIHNFRIVDKIKSINH